MLLSVQDVAAVLKITVDKICTFAYSVIEDIGKQQEMQRTERVYYQCIWNAVTERESRRLKAIPCVDNRSASGSRFCEQRYAESYLVAKHVEDTLRQMSEGDKSPLNRVEPRITSSLGWSYPFIFS